MTTENETHPLLQKEFRGIRDWKTWKRVWEEAAFTDQLIGLLHVAFDVEAYGAEYYDRLTFLLRVADGHATPSFEWERSVARAKAPGFDWDTARRRIETAKPIVEKAYKVLCDRYFKHRCGEDGRDASSPLGDLSLEWFQALLWFFHDYDRWQGLWDRGRNLPKEGGGHHDGVTRRYVSCLIRECWEYDRRPGDEHVSLDEGVKAAISEAGPKFVALLHDLGELHVLYSGKRKVDEPMIEALRRIAFTDRDGKQVHRSAEEAVGSYAGRSLLILEAKMRNDERLRRIAEAERRRREAERDLEEACK